MAQFFGSLANTLVIEFVPKDDSRVQRLLATRQDVFPDYTQEAFEAASAPHFDILAREGLPGSCRTLFAMRRKA